MKKSILGVLLSSICILAFASCAGINQNNTTEKTTPKESDVVTPTTSTEVVIPTTEITGTNPTTSPIETTTQTNPLQEHAFVKHDAVEAKCDTNGNIEYYTCTDSECANKFFVKEGENYTEVASVTVNALGHNYSNPTYVWDNANCTATRICERDRTHIETETVNASYIKDTDATCKDDEKGHYVATFTNAIFETQSTALNSATGDNKALGHTLDAVTGVNAGATSSGFKTYYECSRCHECFEDEKAEKPISDLNLWKAEGGAGYIAPLTEHKSFETPEIPGELDPSYVSVFKRHFEQTYRNDGPYEQEDAFPSLSLDGKNPTMLVIPVNLYSKNKTDEIYDNIKLAFEGSSEETGWESVRTYYQKSSYGKLTIDFEFTDWFTPKYSYTEYQNKYFDDEYEIYWGDAIILEEAIAYFDSTIDFSKYDFDNDGKVDNIWLVYNCPVDYDEAKLYWAWQTKYEDDDGNYDTLRADGKIISRYGWAGTDFMDPTKEAESYNKENILVDAHTFIHETGHIMGNEDYYDYDEEVGVNNRNLFGADMMDFNIGDHSSFNKLALGWIDPMVVSGTGTKEITLESFTETGQVLMIANHKLNTLWDEYFLIELYTNTGLNANDCPIGDEDTIGIRILHVDAHLALDEQGNKTSNDDEYYPGTGFKYDNTGTDIPLIEMLRADDENLSFPDITADALFMANGKTFGVDTHQSFKLNDGTNLFFTLSVKSISNSQCTIEITLD